MNKKSLYIGVGVIVIMGICFSFLLGFYITKENESQLYNVSDSLVSELAEKYPDAEEKVIREMISDGIQLKNGGVLEQYGIEKENFQMKSNDGKIHISIVVGMSVLFAAVSCGIILLLICYVRKQNQQLEELERYCEAVLQEKAALDLRDNEEGNFSVLKNKVYDITVLLREKNLSLEKQKKETERLIADISHQLKTPITSLHMVNELLYMDLPEEKRMEFLGNMQNDLLKIEWFVKTILNLAKLDSKTLVLKREKISAGELSEEVVEYFKIFCEMNQCEITVSQEDDIQIWCDKKWSREAIYNIVKNAIEHEAKHIQMRWTDNSLYTKLEIADDGEGIAKEEVSHVFDRFYKAKNSKEDSMGLGMAFAKSIIEYQNGEIKVKSKKGEGTVFVIKFYKNYA